MRSKSYTDLMDDVTRKLCPFCLGLAKRQCLANNCMAWRLERRGEYFVGWCGIAGKPALEGWYESEEAKK